MYSEGGGIIKILIIDSKEKYDVVMEAIEEVSSITWESGYKPTDIDKLYDIEFTTMDDGYLTVLPISYLAGKKVKILTVFEFLRLCKENFPKEDR